MLRHDSPVDEQEVAGSERRPEATLRHARQHQPRCLGIFHGHAEKEQDEVKEQGDGHEAHEQDPNAVGAFHDEGEQESVRRARAPLPQTLRIEETRQRLPVRSHPAHQPESGQGNGPPGAGEEPGRHRVGDEAKQVGETKMPDRHEHETSDEAGDHEQRGHGHERGRDRRVDRSRSDGGRHRAEHRRRDVLRHRKRALVSAAQSDQQAEDSRAEQQHAGALGGKRMKWPVEDDAGDGETVEDDDGGEDPGREDRSRKFRRQEVVAKPLHERHLAPRPRVAGFDTPSASTRTHWKV